MLEFTGERMVPGGSDDNLFNEHLARYRFAAFFARNLPQHPAILDAGCGSGYGADEFGFASSVTGIDLSADAVRHAREAATVPNVRFLQSSCERLPFADGTFDMVTAFEVIEHLTRWPDLLSESRRVLKPGGVLLVSTPNKKVYAESRAEAGPNPFHVHEFEPEEFREALQRVFPNVCLWAQDHTEGVGFVREQSRQGSVEWTPDLSTIQSAGFVVAACSIMPLPQEGSFAWLPASANVLGERLRHIVLLEQELLQQKAWLCDLQEVHARLSRTHAAVVVELEERNHWAASLNREIGQARRRIQELEEEAARDRRIFAELQEKQASEDRSRMQWIRGLEEQIAGFAELQEKQVSEDRSRMQWIRGLEEQIAGGICQIESLSGELASLRQAFLARTDWGESLAAQLETERAGAQAFEQEAARTISQLREALNDTKAQLNDTNAQLDDTKAQLDDTKAQLDDTKAQLDDTNAQLDDTNARLDDTNGQLARCRQVLREAAQSKIVRISNKLGLGPKISEL